MKSLSKYYWKLLIIHFMNNLLIDKDFIVIAVMRACARTEKEAKKF